MSIVPGRGARGPGGRGEVSVRYPVVEVLHTFQGEGVHAGRSCLLVRLWGCDQRCGWCDTPESWHPDFRPRTIPRMEVSALVDLLRPYASRAAFVLLTGGEPTLFPLDPLIRAVKETLNLPVHLETAGHHPLPSRVDWVTVSPKTFPGARPPRQASMRRADEIKVVVAHPEDVARSLPWVRLRRRGVPVWFHPEWSRREDPAVLQAILRVVQEDPDFRAGYQIHKLYGVDESGVILRASALNRLEGTYTIMGAPSRSTGGVQE